MAMRFKSFSEHSEHYYSVEIRRYLERPGKIASKDEIAKRDEEARDLIEDCNRLLSDLIKYRIELTKRYNDLATMQMRKMVKLERVVSYKNSIFYYVRQFDIFEDGTVFETSYEKFPGKLRRKAIERFNEIQQQIPDIEAIKYIDKKSWER